MNLHPMRLYGCRFCPASFPARATDPFLARLFCPRCRALYVAAWEALVRFEGAHPMERFGDVGWLFVANLRRRGEAA